VPKKPAKRTATRWLTRPRQSKLLDLGRALYQLHVRLTGDSWWHMAKRAHLSCSFMQRFLALREIQKAHSGKAVSNIEAIFEEMGHELVPVPIAVLPVIQKIVDDHYEREHAKRVTDAKEPHGPTTHA
jgi:hypothetical protein